MLGYLYGLLWQAAEGRPAKKDDGIYLVRSSPEEQQVEVKFPVAFAKAMGKLYERELYPCKPDIFEATYQAVEAEEALESQ